MGRAGRERVIARWSVDRMVEGYQDLIAGIYAAKSGGVARGESAAPAAAIPPTRSREA
jgi:hypothetical protein